MFFLLFSWLFPFASVFFAVILDHSQNHTLWGSSVEENQIVVEEVRYRGPIENIRKFDPFYGKTYVGYYIENDNINHIPIHLDNIPNGKFDIQETNANQNTIHYQFKRNRFSTDVYDDLNHATIRLKQGYEILDLDEHPVGLYDLKKRKVFKRECVDKITYNDGMFKFYKLDKQLNSFDFKDSDDYKLNFKTGNTKGKMACVEFDYMETFNRNIVKEKHAEPIIDVIVPEGFDVQSILSVELSRNKKESNALFFYLIFCILFVAFLLTTCYNTNTTKNK